MQLGQADGSGRGKPRVVCVLDAHQRGLPTACAYIRMILPLSDNAVRAHFNVQFVTADEAIDLPADVLVIQRLAFATDAAIDRLLGHRRKSGARLIYELDDDLLAIDRDHIEYAHYAALSRHIRRLVQEADEVWASTEALAVRLRSIAPVVVVQNELDRRLWREAKVSARGENVKILYMGSTTHAGDYGGLLKPAFARLRRDLGERVELALIGVADSAMLSEGIRTIPVPGGIGASYPAFCGWLQSLPSFDVGVAPLLPTEFNHSKSHIKWLEYSALGLATVASDIGEYGASILQEQNGVLAGSSPDALYSALRDIVLDAPKRARVGQSAAEFARRQMASPVTISTSGPADKVARPVIRKSGRS